MMGSFGFTELLLILIILIIMVLPIWAGSKVAKKAGFSPYWSITLVIPLANLVIFWAFAFVDEWPNIQRPGAGSRSPGS